MIDWILKVEREYDYKLKEPAAIIYEAGNRNYAYLNLGFTPRAI